MRGGCCICVQIELIHEECLVVQCDIDWNEKIYTFEIWTAKGVQMSVMFLGYGCDLTFDDYYEICLEKNAGVIEWRVVVQYFKGLINDSFVEIQGGFILMCGRNPKANGVPMCQVL